MPPLAFSYLQAKLRLDGDKPYVTDNSNYIVDLYFEVSVISDFEEPDLKLDDLSCSMLSAQK
jgi:ribose 5-phosphate isomerase